MGGIAIAGISIAAYVILTPTTDPDIAPNSPVAENRSVGDSDLVSGDALVDEFLERNDWTSDSLNNFLLTWSLLTVDQREQTVDGRRYRRLTTRLHQRISEEAALSAVSNSDRMNTLTGFAATIGVPYRVSPSADSIPKPDVLTVIEMENEQDDIKAEPQVSAEVRDDAVAVLSETTNKPDTPVVTPAATVIEARETVAEFDSDLQAAAPEETGISNDDPCHAEIATTRQPYCRDKLADGDMAPLLVVLQPGSYEMGSGKEKSESPPHQVDINYHIAVSRFEITAGEYEQFCAATSLPCEARPWDADYPVVSVSWNDANQYTEWLSESTGFTYRLPSEAEWEYAARAGTQSPYFFGNEITPTAALSSVNGPVHSPVPTTNRTINRNPFRLYHISGNVREWTQDGWYPDYDGAPVDGSVRTLETGGLRVVRGGSYSDQGSRLRSAAREPLERTHRDALTGFRVVREILQ